MVRMSQNVEHRLNKANGIYDTKNEKSWETKKIVEQLLKTEHTKQNGKADFSDVKKYI